MDSQQHEIQEETTYKMDSICSCNFSNKGDNDNTANTVSSSINVDKIETEGIGTVSSVVRACDTDVSCENRTDDLVLAKFLKYLLNETVEERINLAKYCNVLL